MEHCGFFFSAERLKIRDLKIKNFFRFIFVLSYCFVYFPTISIDPNETTKVNEMVEMNFKEKFKDRRFFFSCFSVVVFGEFKKKLDLG